MGTNYYVVKKIDQLELIEDLTNIIISNNSFDVDERVKEFLEYTVGKVHIGKSSGGWKFLFNHNDCKYYDKTRESIDKFIRENELYDEYGEPCDPDEFWKLVDSKKDGLDNETYYNNNKHLYNPFEYKDHYYEEYNDNLRFSTVTEFS